MARPAKPDRRPLGRQSREGAAPGQRDRRQRDPPRARRRARFRRGACVRAPHRRAGAARARLPAARRAPEGARGLPERAARKSSTRSRATPARRAATAGSTSKAAPARLYAYASIGGNELPSGNVLHEGPPVVARQEGQLRGDPHPGAARRRRGPHQRVQLPGLGPAREVRADLPRRHAVHRQAGDRDQLPHRGAGADDDGSGLLPPGALQLVIGPTGDLLDRLDSSDVVTFTGSADTALKLRAQRQPAGALDPVQRRGRFAQRRDPRPRRRARTTRSSTCSPRKSRAR